MELERAQESLQAAELCLQAGWVNTELIHRRKIYPATFRDYLASGLVVRQAADYGRA
jgi:hypothetical protein